MQSTFQRHRQWWLEQHLGESSELQAIGLFKALRNFINPYLKSQTLDSKGIDYYEDVRESLGDMIMYLWSICHAEDYDHPNLMESFAGFNLPQVATVPYAIYVLSTNFANLLISRQQDLVNYVFTLICLTCEMCLVNVDEAIETSMGKCKCINRL